MSGLIRDRVRLEVGGPVARLTLANPDAGNALDLPMALALRDAVCRLADDPALRVVRLDAEGKAFCVGGDLREFGGVEDPCGHVASVAAAAHAALTGLRELTAPVVTVVQGVAAGGGLGLALVGDIVLVGSRVKLRVAYTAAGLSPDCGVSHHLARVLGPARALDLALSNRTLTAETAEAWGLVSRVVADDQLEGTAAALAQELAEGAGEALAATKRLLRDASGREWTEQLTAEAASIARLAGSADGREGVAAFLAKREPRFR
jgi:2-(1,2-epoxy-1,2-dihydrophenyl)acetyl-CoA isomerase